MKKVFNISIFILIIILTIASDLFAIPAFARKYTMSCKTCHSPIPYLKDYGNEFAGNGFQLPDKDAPRYYVATGDERLSLIRDFPVAVRFEGFVTYNQGNTEQSDFTTPVAFKLLTGGTITNDIAYYAYYILENGEVGKIEDAWLMFNNLFGTELDITVGQFQISDPLFKRELRLTKDDYYIYKVKPGHSDVDLTYDRGLMFSYGFDSGTDIVLEIINGNGIGESIASGNFDDDNYKNLFARITQDAGENFRIGALGYYGNEEEANFYYPPFPPSEYINEVWMLGGDATISFDPFDINLQYVERKDGNPSFSSPRFLNDYSETIKTRGGFAEIIYRPQGDESDWYSVALFNWIESNQTELNLKQLGIHFGYLLSRNIRLVTEYSHNFTGEYGKIGLGFVTAF
jgi:hypothetical protein